MNLTRLRQALNGATGRAPDTEPDLCGPATLVIFRRREPYSSSQVRWMKRIPAAAVVACGGLVCIASGVSAQEEAIPLDTVHVTISSIASAEMASSTRSVDVLSAAEIERLPVRTVPDVLRWALGVDLMPRSPALVDVGVRGSSFEQVLVMVDGVRVSDAQTGHFDLDLAVPLAQVERIEILRGPASTLHGADAVGGVINVVTRHGEGSQVRLETGSFGTAGMALSHTISAGEVRFDVATDLRRSDGHRPGTDYETLQGRLAVAGPIGERRVDASVAWAGRDFGARGFYGSNPDWDEFEKTRATTASIALRSPVGARMAIEPVLSYRRHRDDFVLRRDDPSFYQNLHTTDQLGGKLTARYAHVGTLRLAAGGELYHDRLESESLGDRSENRGALLAELAAGRVGHVTAVAGARLDWHERHGSFVSPSASVAWWPVESLRFRASLGRALRTPTWTERYYRDPANEGSADLAPERSWSGEIGVDATPAEGVRVGVAIFQREAEDLIDWARGAGSDGVWVTRNVESARFRGLEARLAVTDALGTRWTAHGSWLSLRSSTPDAVESKYALRPLAESVTAGVDRPLPGGFGVAVRATRARRVGEDAHLRADARVWFERSGLRLYLDGQNLGDESYLDIARIEAPGRALLIGLEWAR